VKKSPSNNSIFEQKTILTFITYEWSTAPWWAFKLNTVLATAENWHLKGHMPRVKNKCSYFLPHSMDEKKNQIQFTNIYYIVPAILNSPYCTHCNQ